MRVISQTVDEILDSLQGLVVDWRDDMALRVISRLQSLPQKATYEASDVGSLLDDSFDDGMLICRLFLGQSKDNFEILLKSALGDSGIGVKRYKKNPQKFLSVLSDLGLLEAMTVEVNRVPVWSDVLVERLRSGRGSAISGQRRGRGVEDFAESIIRKVFGDSFDARCNFVGQRGQTAKCDFAVPSKSAPSILIEAKGYGATGSKMTDVLGDIEKIITAKRPDTSFLLLTDGLTWKQRVSDLKKIVGYQNDGEITRIYTYAMERQFEADLRQLKMECQL